MPEDDLNTLYNLILNPATRDWERSLLTSTKQEIEGGRASKQALAKLESELRPLAVRNNLTPDVSDFYQTLVGGKKTDSEYDFVRHATAMTNPQYEHAIFAGGCFWCMVEPFETRPGIISVMSGYTGGHTESPTYDQVMSQTTGHLEAVEIVFDPHIIQYRTLLTLFWSIVDPTDNAGQVNDRGEAYRPAIFVENEEQRRLAEASKQLIIDSNRYQRPIVTEIQDTMTFWPAENFHQEFYKKNQRRYHALEHSRRQFFATQRLTNWLHRVVHR